MYDQLKATTDLCRTQKFTYYDSLTGQTLSLANIIASYSSANTRRIMLCAHWDSRPRSDQDPDSALARLSGALGGREVVFLSRHSRGHRILPSELNHRANIWGMKSLGVERILSLSAVGSLKEEHKPLDFIIPYQFVDRTRGRVSTFFGEGLVALTDRADRLVKAAHAAGADAADAVAVRSMSLAIEVRDGNTEESERAEGDDLGLRVFVGRRQAVVSTNEVTANGAAALAERAVAMARATPEDRFAGLADDKLLAHKFPELDLIDPEHRETARQAYLNSSRTGQPFDMEYRMRKRDGEEIWVHDRARILRAKDGAPLWIHGVIFDVTERRKSEERLRQSQERFSKAFRSSPNGISILTRRDGRFLNVDSNYRENKPELRVQIDRAKANAVGQRYLTATIVSAALSESIAIFGLVLTMVTRDTWYVLGLGALGLVNLLLYRPTAETLRNLLRAQAPSP